LFQAGRDGRIIGRFEADMMVSPNRPAHPHRRRAASRPSIPSE
jgi:hypothetical protein